MKEKAGKRAISREGRVRMGAAGFKNLAKYKASINTRVLELEAEVAAYRDGLLRDAGANLTTTKRGLIEAATSTYAAVLKVRYALIHSRKRDVEALTAVLSAATGNIARLLRLLDLDRKARPRSLADVFTRKDTPKDTPTVEIERAKSSIPTESEGKPA